MNLKKDARAVGREYGKKIATHVVVTAPGQVVSVDIRFKADTGKFHAEVDGHWFTNTELESLKQAVTKAIKESVTIDYDPYIEVTKPRDLPSYGRAPLEVKLEYRLLLVSRQTLTRKSQYGDEKPYRVCKDAKPVEDGERLDPTYGEQTSVATYGDYRSAVLVPFTPERLRTIVRIGEAILAARANLLALLEAADVGALLDGFNPGRLLEAPKRESP